MLYRHAKPRTRKRGFTLVELLVVIGIIALLISILLPALNKARRAASTVKCGANLRGIGQALQMYASQNKGYFPSPNTSGYHLLTQSSLYTAANCPDISAIYDWQAPLAIVQNIKFERGPSGVNRAVRLFTLIEYPGFLCPDNVGVTAVKFGGDAPNWMQSFSGGGRTWGAGAKQLNSYNTAIAFQWVPTNTRQPFTTPSPTGRSNASFITLPGGYAPKLNKIGNASRKIYMADGSRYTNSSTSPDMDTSLVGSLGGAWADWGPFSAFSNGFNRDLAPGNGGTAGNDVRLLWARHGSVKARQSSDSYKFNALFFDGHVQLMGDLEGANPMHWFPKGTIVPNSEFYADVKAKYGITGDLTVGE